MAYDRKIPGDYFKETDGGRVEEIRYDSIRYCYDGGKVTKRALVYLPAGYDSCDRRYRVLYLMHGGGGNEEEILYGPDKSMALKNIFDHMFKNGDSEPVIVVTPTFYYSDSQSALHDIKDAAVLTKNYHNEFRNDLLPAIDAHYRTVADREGRAFGGFSMGAETTWEMFLNSLDLIKNFLPMSGDCWIVTEKGGASEPALTSELMKKYLKEKGFDAYSYNVFAFTGDKDIAYEPLDAQIKAMRADGFGAGQDKRLRYESWPEGVHSYSYCYEYIYNVLSEVL